jgi:hypothetical protein
VRNIIRTLIRVKRSQKLRTPEFLRGDNDFPSVEEFIAPHIEDLKRNRDVKGVTTFDPKTIDAARNVFRNNKGSGTLDFFEKTIFTQPQRKTSEAGSIKVRISDIHDFSKYVRDYESDQDKDSMICIGGPASEDQVVMATIIAKIRDRLSETTYLTRNYQESNVSHSARQSHARHANALNADESLTGHSLLPILMMRKLLGTDLEDVLESDYRKIDVKFDIDPKKLRIYFGNELNWLRQEYKRRKGELTEHDINRMEAVLSQEIMSVIEQEAEISISGGVKRSVEDSSSVHVTFAERDSEEVKHENELFRKAGIDPQKLTREEINFLFQSDEIAQAWKYPGDTHSAFNDHEVNQEFAEKNGAKWVEGVEVDRILLAKNEHGKARVAGVMTKDGQYFYANKLHFSGGYKVDYVFDKDSETRFLSRSTFRNLLNRIEDAFDLQKPLSNEITTATGISINAIFRKSERINKIIERYGSTGEIAVTNSHWTMIAHDNEHVVVRITAGGNTGSEEYNPAYFLNVIANTRRIFGDDLVGILSTYGCPRAINARNSTEFAKIAEGGVISYGKGGTGNTKRHAEAATGLMMIGFEDEVIEYFNRFQSRTGKPLGDELELVYKHIQGVNFIHDNTERTNRRMGYDESLSAEETISMLLVVAALSYALHKAVSKDKEPSVVMLKKSAESLKEAQQQYR